MSETQDFAQLAERFCSLIEGAAGAQPRGFLARAEEALSRAYAAAAGLPDIEPETTIRPAEPVTSAEWGGRYEELKAVLGPYDSYVRSSGSGAVRASLADDLLAVYRELAEGLQLLHSGAPPEEVIGHWRVAFTDRWAEPAAGALEAMRAALRP